MLISGCFIQSHLFIYIYKGCSRFIIANYTCLSVSRCSANMSTKRPIRRAKEAAKKAIKSPAITLKAKKANLTYAIKKKEKSADALIKALKDHVDILQRFSDQQGDDYKRATGFTAEDVVVELAVIDGELDEEDVAKKRLEEHVGLDFKSISQFNRAVKWNSDEYYVTTGEKLFKNYTGYLAAKRIAAEMEDTYVKKQQLEKKNKNVNKSQSHITRHSMVST